jgi:hypothetical protein
VDRIDYGNTLAVPVEYSAYSQITANLLAYFITSVYTTGSLVTVGIDAPSLRRCTVALITRYISAHDVAVVGVDYGCGSRTDGTSITQLVIFPPVIEPDEEMR